METNQITLTFGQIKSEIYTRLNDLYDRGKIKNSEPLRFCQSEDGLRIYSTNGELCFIQKEKEERHACN